jgi:hypothetical protein
VKATDQYSMRVKKRDGGEGTSTVAHMFYGDAAVCCASIHTKALIAAHIWFRNLQLSKLNFLHIHPFRNCILPVKEPYVCIVCELTPL